MSPCTMPPLDRDLRKAYLHRSSKDFAANVALSTAHQGNPRLSCVAQPNQLSGPAPLRPPRSPPSGTQKSTPPAFSNEMHSISGTLCQCGLASHHHG